MAFTKTTEAKRLCLSDIPSVGLSGISRSGMRSVINKLLFCVNFASILIIIYHFSEISSLWALSIVYVVILMFYKLNNTCIYEYNFVIVGWVAQ
jgi:hypothetical protein